MGEKKLSAVSRKLPLKWLEQYLKGYKGTIVMVSHDRYFLDQMTNRIFEVSHHKVFSAGAKSKGLCQIFTIEHIVSALVLLAETNLHLTLLRFRTLQPFQMFQTLFSGSRTLSKLKFAGRRI